MVTLAVDAMGGDFGPQVTVPAVLKALQANQELRVLLLGDEAAITRAGKCARQPRLKIHHSDQQVSMDESPAFALRAKKDSSMGLMLQAIKSGEADACVSAGNTGALMALSRHILKMSDAIDRPALVSALPRADGQHTLMLDLGANINCDSELLYQFALLGQAVAFVLDNNAKPRIALLNIGSEASKGNDQIRAAHSLLENDPQLNYVGYIEGSELFSNFADVVVCDGFVGNVALKTIEGLAHFIIGQMKQEFDRVWWRRIIGLILQPFWRRVEAKINPSGYSGAVLIGLRGLVIKSHGDSSVNEFYHALLAAQHYVEKSLISNVDELLRTEVTY